MSKQYIPGKDAEFDAWIAFLIQYVLKKTAGSSPVWPNIPPDAVLALSAVLTAWQTAFQKLSGPHTQVSTRRTPRSEEVFFWFDVAVKHCISGEGEGK
jgi:hypothetical protein